MVNLALVIEDDPEIAEVIELAIKVVLGCEVVFAPNGEVGLYEAAERQPDLIFLDWIMPEKSGLVALTELKSDAKTAAIPVYMITRKTSQVDVQKAFEAGAAGYFVKPIKFDALCAWLAERFPALADVNSIPE